MKEKTSPVHSVTLTRDTVAALAKTYFQEGRYDAFVELLSTASQEPKLLEGVKAAHVKLVAEDMLLGREPGKAAQLAAAMKGTPQLIEAFKPKLVKALLKDLSEPSPQWGPYNPPAFAALAMAIAEVPTLNALLTPEMMANTAALLSPAARDYDSGYLMEFAVTFKDDARLNGKINPVDVGLVFREMLNEGAAALEGYDRGGRDNNYAQRALDRIEKFAEAMTTAPDSWKAAMADQAADFLKTNKSCTYDSMQTFLYETAGTLVAKHPYLMDGARLEKMAAEFAVPKKHLLPGLIVAMDRAEHLQSATPKAFKIAADTIFAEGHALWSLERAAQNNEALTGALAESAAEITKRLLASNDNLDNLAICIMARRQTSPAVDKAIHDELAKNGAYLAQADILELENGKVTSLGVKERRVHDRAASYPVDILFREAGKMAALYAAPPKDRADGITQLPMTSLGYISSPKQFVLASELSPVSHFLPGVEHVMSDVATRSEAPAWAREIAQYAAK